MAKEKIERAGMAAALGKAREGKYDGKHGALYLELMNITSEQKQVVTSVGLDFSELTKKEFDITIGSLLHTGSQFSNVFEITPALEKNVALKTITRK
ncbi:MAG: hypothetical protein ACREBF_02670 [Candidatus Micrarchaeales archaeon]